MMHPKKWSGQKQSHKRSMQIQNSLWLQMMPGGNKDDGDDKDPKMDEGVLN